MANKHLLDYVEELGVKIDLDHSSREKAISAADSFIKEFDDHRRQDITDRIATAILRELRMSVEINKETIEKVIEFFPHFPEEEKKKKEDIWSTGSGSDSDSDSEDEEEEEDDIDWGENFDLIGGCRDKKKEAEAVAVAEPTDEDIKALENQLSEIEYRLKPEDKQEIMNQIIRFVSNFSSYSTYWENCMDLFMKRILDYINSYSYVKKYCILNNLGKVNCAIETVKRDLQKKLIQDEDNEDYMSSFFCKTAWRELEANLNREQQQMLKKNVIPTKAAENTSGHLLKQEQKREPGELELDMEIDESRKRKYVGC